MPAIKPDRVLGDLYKLRTFGTYKTGVHRPTFSPDDIAARNWFAEQCTAAGLETSHRRHRQYFRQEQGDAAPRRCPARTWKARTTPAGSTAPLGCVYALEASRAIKEAGGDAGVDVVVFCDEEGHFGIFLGSRIVHRRCSRTSEIDKARNSHDGTPMRDALAKAGYAGPAARRDRAGALHGVLRGAYRAGRHARNRPSCASASSRRSSAIWQYWRHGDRRAEPRRHDLDDAPARRRARAGAAAARDRRALPGDLRAAHGVDDGTDHARPGQPQHHPGPRRDRCSSCATPIPRCSTRCMPSCSRWSTRPIARAAASSRST